MKNPRLLFAVNTWQNFHPELFKDLGIGVEIQGISLDDADENELETTIKKYEELLDNFEGPVSLHGNFIKCDPASDDKATLLRTKSAYQRSIRIANRLHATNVIFHAQMPSESSIEDIDATICAQLPFWQEILKEIEGTPLIISLENVHECDPEYVLRLVREINSPKVGICLDIGHLNIASKKILEEWVSSCSYYINYIHVHENRGISDDHRSAGRETWKKILGILAIYELNPLISLEYHNLNANAIANEIRKVKRAFRLFIQNTKSPYVPQFFIRIVLPSLLAIFMFVLVLFLLVVPSFEKEMIDRKKEMLRELTYSAESILKKYHHDEEIGILSSSEAQAKAAGLIKNIRYGLANKDYFWITDLEPRMIMHPYREDLDNTLLKDFTDPSGKKLFVEFVAVVSNSPAREGYTEYMWQWMDQQDKIVPKLSFVKLFEPWSWIIGTGIYIEDIKEEIFLLKRSLLYMLSAISIVMAVLLVYLIQQSLRIEQRRKQAEEGLKESREKYRSLVEASTEGIIMILSHRFVYVNRVILNTLGYTEEEFLKSDISSIILPLSDSTRADKAEAIIRKILQDEVFGGQVELNLKKRNGEFIRVFLTISPISFVDQHGYIMIMKDLTDRLSSYTEYFFQSGSGSSDKNVTETKERLLTELETAFQTLNQPIINYVLPACFCRLSTSIVEGVGLMIKKNSSALIVTSEQEEPLGIVTAEDIKTRVVATGFDSTKPIYQIMTSPIVTIPSTSLVFEANLHMQENNVNHLLVAGTTDQIAGIIDIQQISRLSGYAPFTLLHAIHTARTIEDISVCQKRLPGLVDILIEGGSNTRSINRIITIVADAVVEKLINLSIEEMGPKPCAFSFVAIGSQGREEQTLITDQDNAIIYEDGTAENAAMREHYFLELGKKICSQLDLLGYYYCNGKVMANNPIWCQPVSIWMDYFKKRIDTPNPKDILELKTFFDMRRIYGEKRLLDDIRHTVQGYLNGRDSFFNQLALEAVNNRPPLGIFGTITVANEGDKRETFDIKKVMLIVVDLARYYAMRNNISGQNTLDRLQDIADSGLMTRSSHRDISGAYNYLMQLRIKHQVAQIRSGQEPDNNLNPKTLSSLETAIVKESFQLIANFQKKIEMEFRRI